ncbi:glycosyl transferase family 90 [Neisseria shayeganii]|uniref:Lipopolysaccharide biosynthesis protein LpsA n=1 Tax=Neisseria shayeganii 871 TaxID=1032488 RepID=G4CET6_9NEIS|nr:glycosyl transferase family 90 [Neisseria shayeganii]EGY53671.1 lipopolysaccharide biosynthesis protein LpsA [Neisseria shayeganii 871]
MSQAAGIYHKRLHKLAYYTRHSLLGVLPHTWLVRNGQDVLREFSRLNREQQQALHSRVDYYNRLSGTHTLHGASTAVGSFKKCGHSAYFYDLAALLRYFPADERFLYEFGDVTHIPEQPAFVKSRPIADNNQNSVLLKLDSVRHFYIYPDPHRFADKQDSLVWRGAAHQCQRLRFLEQYHNHPLCDVGCVHPKSAGQPYHRSFLTVEEQLRHKYILSIEGNDVATNLKWIMASQSLCFMAAPRYETWLMEGRLQADVHYVHLQDDYADLDEKLAFYHARPAAAERIIRQANAYMQPFFDRKLELLTGLMVVQKYFDCTSPIN